MTIVNSTITPYYDLTNISLSNNAYEFVKASNDLTGQIFMMGILIAGFVIMFMTLKDRSDTQDALVVSTFITAIGSVIMSSLDFVPPQMMYLCIASFAIIFTMTLLKNRFN